MEDNKKQKNPEDILRQIALKNNLDIFSQDFALFMDEEDPLREFRKRFAYPKKGTLKGTDPSLIDKGEECIYLCGNSLGLKPLVADERVHAILKSWADCGVEMHFREPVPAALCDQYGRRTLARLVGAREDSVILMNGLTVNLHLLLLAFYKPTAERYKIVIEGHAFPSDRYAVASQVELRGFSPEDAVLEVKPREGEHTIRTEDVLKLLEREGESIAVVCLSAVQYYTGQLFEMRAITEAAHEVGCAVGWDLAHAIGNVEMRLDAWGVDFAMWCTYKYLNSGPGCLGGAYLNRRHKGVVEGVLKGWWGNKEETRFEMRQECDVAEGIDGFRLCNPPPLLATLVLGSLEIFEDAGMGRILDKQFLLTGYLELLLRSYFGSGQVTSPSAEIITPTDVRQRGCQLSLIFSYPLQQVHQELTRRGVVCDVRMPNVMRLAPVPLYNSFCDVYKFISVLKEVFDICKTEAA